MCIIFAKMRSQWVIWLLLVGVAYVAGSSCNVSKVEICYEDLVQYESIVFPLYGENGAKLDDTCGNIALSYNCCRSYVETCKASPECKEDCKQIIKEIHGFISNSGLEKFSEDLCPEDSPLRQTYLENVECLEGNADEYAACQNDSQKSLSFLSTIHGEETIAARCCYTTWYNGCFTNVTRDACGESATIFVSYALHILVGHMMDILCSEAQVVCDRPPLPQEGHVKDKENEPEPTENEIDNEIPNETHNKTDKINGNSNNAAAIRLSVTSIVILSYIFIMLSKCIL